MIRHSRTFTIGKTGLAALTMALFVIGCEKQETPKDELPQAIPYVMLGVSLETDSKAGLSVSGVLPNSPAGSIELQEGDRIVKIGEQEVSQASEVAKFLAETTPGTTISLTVQKGNDLIPATVEPVLVYFPYQNFATGFEINKFCDGHCDCTLDQSGFFCLVIYRYIGEGPNGGVLLQKICVATEGPGQPKFPTACDVGEYI